ncbi:MAG: KH domain-containing protein [Bacilli bacterium]|nr:KH domain-containing protein [Bacilli bacterium]
MNKYTAKTLNDVLALASEKEGCTIEELNYQVIEEKKGLFVKKVVIETYGVSDVISFAKDYLLTIIANYDLEGTVTEKYENNIIHLTIDTNHNSILIGKNGKTLQALNDVCRYAVASKFKKHYRILLDINEYKNEKYAKLSRIAKRVAKEVLHTKQTVHLDPMPADERRIVHNSLTKFKNISTQSEGNGNRRHIVISYKD